MSLVVSIREKKKNGKIVIHMGGDSAITEGSRIIITDQPKVFIRDDIIFGCIGSPGLINLIKYDFEIPERTASQESDEYIFRTLTKSLIEFCVPEQYIQDKDGGLSVAIIIGYDGIIYSSDFLIELQAVLGDYKSLGTGGDYADGFLAASDRSNPTKLIKTVIKKVSREFNSVRPPVVIEKLEC